MASFYEGKDGFLFLTDDSNRLHDQLTGRLTLPQATIDDIAQTHARRARVAAECGAVYRHVVAPEKDVVLSDWLPDAMRSELRPDARPLRQYLAAHPDSAGLFYDDAYLIALAARHLIYARQDTHWTYLGAYQYFHRMLRSLAPAEEFAAYCGLKFRRSNSFANGDLGVMAGRDPEPVPTVGIPRTTARMALENDIENIGRVRLYRNDAAPLKKRVLVFHDSVVNWLTWALGGLYRETLLVHHADVDLEFVRRFSPDILYFFQIERFFVRAPLNDLNLVEEVATLERRKGAAASVVPYLRRIRDRSETRTRVTNWVRRRGAPF